MDQITTFHCSEADSGSGLLDAFFSSSMLVLQLICFNTLIEPSSFALIYLMELTGPCNRSLAMNYWKRSDTSTSDKLKL